MYTPRHKRLGKNETDNVWHGRTKCDCYPPVYLVRAYSVEFFYISLSDLLLLLLDYVDVGIHPIRIELEVNLTQISKLFNCGSPGPVQNCDPFALRFVVIH